MASALTGNEVVAQLEKIFPNAHCELNHRNPFELLVAVTLSAQTTDASVNKVTPHLFKKYPDCYAMAKAPVATLEKEIKTIGLYHNKAKNIKGLSQGLISLYDGKVPDTMDELTALPGVGRKTANVVMSVCFNYPSIAVDTHVERVSKRLGLAYKNDSVLTVEKKLMKKIDKDKWSRAHHLMIFFGRYMCKAMHPQCYECPFVNNCKEKKKNLTK